MIAMRSLSIISNKTGGFALFASLFLFIISIAAYAGLYYLNKTQENTQQQLIEQIETKENDLRLKQLDQVFSLKNKIELASSVIASHGFAANTFSFLEASTHPFVQFNSYSFLPEQQTIMLKGEAADYSVLARQIAFLEGDKQVSKVEFGGLVLKPQNRVEFNLTIHVTPTLLATMQ